MDAKAQYIVKRNHFLGLTLDFGMRVLAWKVLSRKPTRSNGQVESVYRGNEFKGKSPLILHHQNTVFST